MHGGKLRYDIVHVVVFWVCSIVGVNGGHRGIQQTCNNYNQAVKHRIAQSVVKKQLEIVACCRIHQSQPK